MKFSKNVIIFALLISIGIGFAIIQVVPGKHDRAGKVGDLSDSSDEEKRFFAQENGLFESKKKPSPSDWLAQHREPGQTYGQWLNAAPNMPNKKKGILYVMPLGKFDKDAPSLDALKELMEAYYFPLDVRIMQPVADAKVKAKSRMNNGVKQWKSVDILGWMGNKLPKDAYAMLAVTMTDLYPDEKWNFVFGQASLKNRVGVFSFARYADPEESLALMRAGKILTHEMGHMFGILHCTFYECNMNGANHLDEVDSSPPHLCPVCLRKVHKAAGFDLSDRYEKLKAYYKKYKHKKAEGWVKKRLAAE